MSSEADDLKCMREIAYLRHRVAVLERQVKEIKDSTSWRITAPLRAFISGRTREGLDAADAGAGNTHLHVSPLVPGELVRAPSIVSAGAHAAKIDAWPWLAALAHGRVYELATGCLKPGTEAGPVDPRVSAIGYMGDLALAREIACDVRLHLLDGNESEEVLRGRGISLVLIGIGWGESGSTFAGRLGASDSSLGYGVSGLCCIAWVAGDSPAQIGAAAGLMRTAEAIYCSSGEWLDEIKQKFPGQEVELLPYGVQPAFFHPVLPSALRCLVTGEHRAVLVDALSEVVEGKLTVEEIPGRASAPPVLVDSLLQVTAARALPYMQPGSAVAAGTVDAIGKSFLGKVLGAEAVLEAPLRPPGWCALQRLRVHASGYRLLDEFDHDAANKVPLALRDQMERHLLSRHARTRDSMKQRIQKLADRHAPRLRLLPLPKVSGLLATRRPDRVTEAAKRFFLQTYENKELVVVLHGFDLGVTQNELLHALGDVKVIHAESHRSLGACLNLGFAASDGDYWFKIDDDDFYGRHYIADMMSLCHAADVELVGKPLTFTYFEADDSLYANAWRFSLANTVFEGDWPAGAVCGATLAGTRAVLEANPFPELVRRGADSAFLDECRARRVRLLVADAFNFACIRSKNPLDHTWDGEEMLTRRDGLHLGGRSALMRFVEI